MSLRQVRTRDGNAEALMLDDDDVFLSEDLTATQVQAWFNGEAETAGKANDEIEYALDRAQGYAKERGKPAYIVITINP